MKRIQLQDRAFDHPRKTEKDFQAHFCEFMPDLLASKFLSLQQTRGV
jgi:hypothetical protein